MSEMALIDGLVQGPLVAGDAADAVTLSVEAGWNQTANDWRLMLELGDGVGLRTDAGRLVATALTLPYGGRFAWVCMVLVSTDFRGRGIATRLLGDRIEWTRAAGMIAGLDSTEAGRRVYQPLGFTDIYGLHRLVASGPLPPATETPPGEIRIVPMEAGDIDRVLAYDEPAFGAGRGPVLAYLREHRPERALIAEHGGRLGGFVLARDGRNAHHMGPLVADNEGIAIALASRALDGLAGPVCADVADHHRGLLDWLEGRGFARQRPFTRMVLGGSEPLDDPARVFVIAGPELG